MFFSASVLCSAEESNTLWTIPLNRFFYQDLDFLLVDVKWMDDLTLQKLNTWPFNLCLLMVLRVWKGIRKHMLHLWIPKIPTSKCSTRADVNMCWESCQYNSDMLTLMFIHSEPPSGWKSCKLVSLFQGFVEVCVDSAGSLISNMSTVALQSKAEELESFHHNSHTRILLGLTKPAWQTDESTIC